jgi:hypothetical protein
MVRSEKMKIIYHGSYEIVQYPNIIVGKNTKDFSYGFYCTRIKEEAEKCVNKYKTPVINSYELADISDLKVKVFKEYNEEWLDFVVHCRNGGEHDYDVVEGFMCDDTILDNLEDYINGHIDKLRFLDMMKFNWSDNQISFHTVKALKRIKFISSEKIEK